MVVLTGFGCAQVPTRNGGVTETPANEETASDSQGLSASDTIEVAILDVRQWHTVSNDKCGVSYRYPSDQQVKDYMTARGPAPFGSPISFAVDCYGDIQAYLAANGVATADLTSMPETLSAYLSMVDDPAVLGSTTIYAQPATVAVEGGASATLHLFIDTGKILDFSFPGVDDGVHLSAIQAEILSSLKIK